MTTYNRISGDYNIVSNDPGSNVIVTTNTLVVDGNLDVLGGLTYIESSQTQVTDAFIQLAANNTGSVSNVGILATKDASTAAGLRFNITANAWQISTAVNPVDGSPYSSYANIVTGTALTIAGANTQIQFNNNGALGASANLTYVSSTNTLTLLNGKLQLGNLGTTPSAGSNSAIVYNNAVGSGGTGVFVKSTSVDDELVSKSKAIVYSIIF